MAVHVKAKVASVLSRAGVDAAVMPVKVKPKAKAMEDSAQKFKTGSAHLLQMWLSLTLLSDRSDSLLACPRQD
jgi:hypothetical protein